MTRPRVLVLYPTLEGRGGADLVAAWTLQALVREYDVTVMSMTPIDLAAVDEFCQTDLEAANLHAVVVPGPAERVLSAIPIRLSLLKVAVLARAARRLDAAAPYDCILSAFNEMDFGRPGLQYIHYPWGLLPRPEVEYRWYNRATWALALYHGLVRAVGGMTGEGLRRNRSLANSRFVADLVEGMFGRPCEVLHPPVPGHFDPLPWERRHQEIVCLGRIAREKRIDDVVAIVERVRSRGHELDLRIVGLRDEPESVAQAERLAAERDWFELELDVPRSRVIEAIHGARFGIHAMIGEHFGIAVAEMLRAGCVVFAHDSGGPSEILGGEPDVLFSDVEDAANKIEALLVGQRELREMRRKLASIAAGFSEERFCVSMREHVADFLADQVRADA